MGFRHCGALFYTFGTFAHGFCKETGGVMLLEGTLDLDLDKVDMG